MTHDEWSLTVGEIVAPFALAGELKVRLETDFPDRFARLTQVCVRRTNGEARLCVIESVRPHKGQILLKLRGVDSIEDAEGLRNALVQVRGSDATPLPPDEHYIYHLVGCSVVTSDGRVLGRLTNVMRTGANDVYVIRSLEDREILLPAIKDVVRSIDTTERRIVVTPTPGLIPGDEAEVT